MMVIVSFYTSISIAQTQVKGNIKDVSGEPLIGVSIKEKGTSNGTVSDLDGNFAITTSKSNFLQVSYIGYISQEIKAENGKTLQIVLQENSEILEDVVVVGYGTQKKVNLTGSVSAVTAKELANKPVTSTAQALAGLAPGLSVLQIPDVLALVLLLNQRYRNILQCRYSSVGLD